MPINSRRFSDDLSPASSPNLSSLKEASETTLKPDLSERNNPTYATSHIDDKAKARSRELLKS